VRAGSLSGPRTAPTTGPSRRPVLTVVVCAVTVAVSVAALFSPALMDLFIRDLAQLRAGQWWRAFTPVLVQSDGWGQLAFNLLGLAVVGAALERRVSRPCWPLVFLLGGPGSSAVQSAWKPEATGGGSSDAVAALLGAYIVLLVIDGPRMRWEWPAQLYAVFFAAYLTTLDLAGLVPSMILGNVSIIAFFVARRAVHPATLSRACLVVVSVAGVLMTMAQDGHGTGILTGLAVASLVLARRWLPDRADGSRRIRAGWPSWRCRRERVGAQPARLARVGTPARRRSGHHEQREQPRRGELGQRGRRRGHHLPAGLGGAADAAAAMTARRRPAVGGPLHYRRRRLARRPIPAGCRTHEPGSPDLPAPDLRGKRRCFASPNQRNRRRLIWNP
jgi:membrane associated rhomboid family serine protease